MGDETGNKTAVPKRQVPLGLLRRLRGILACGLAILLCVGVYYIFFVQRKYNHLTGRDFRFLAAIGHQLESSLKARSRQLESFAEEPNLANVPSEFYKPSIENPPANAAPEQPVSVLRGSGDESWIDFYAPRGKDGPALRGSMKLRAIAETFFRPRDAFDLVLLANADGGVVYHQGDTDLSVTRLDWLLRKSIRPRVRNEEEGGKDNEARAFGELLSSSSESYAVELNGRGYRLFVEPIPLPLQSLNGQELDERKVWLVCGLVPTKEFVYKSLAVSSALLSSLLGLLILAALSWPFLKLILVSKTQRVRLFDVLLLGVCSLLGVSIITLFLLDTVFFLNLEEESKQQLESFSDQMEANIRKEIQAAYSLLEGLEDGLAPTAVQGVVKADLLADSKVRTLFYTHYPFAQTFALIGADGQQTYKAVFNSPTTPLIPVRERGYFNRAAEGDLWDLHSLSQVFPQAIRARSNRESQPFYIEPVIGRTSGTPTTMLSRPIAKKNLQRGKGSEKVSTLAIPMLSLINPVLPPGFKFAVITNEERPGEVLFHSDPERMLNEDFLVETDQDRKLRSAVFARRSETMAIRYWGEDYLARTGSVPGLPWTIITLKDMRILRAVNIDWISTTLVMILLYVGLLAAGFVLVAILRPSYRADWIWPDPQRHWDYRILGRAYALYLTGFALVIWGLRGSSELIGLAVLLPALAILMAYLKLHRRGRHALAVGLGSLLLAAFTGNLLLQAPLEVGVPAWLRWAIFLLLCFALLIVSGVLPETGRKVPLPAENPQTSEPAPPTSAENTAAVPSAAPTPPARGARLPWPSVCTSYCLAGVFLLLLTAALPTAGFFKIAYRLHSVSFLRHGQLKLALALKERAAQARLAAARATAAEGPCLLAQRLAVPGSKLPAGCSLSAEARGLDVYAGAFYGTHVKLLAPAAKRYKPWRECRSNADLEILPGFIEKLLPRYSEPAAEMRELLHSRASDCTWYWEKLKPSLVQVFHSLDYPEGQIYLASEVGPTSNSQADSSSEEKVLQSSVGVNLFIAPVGHLVVFAGSLFLLWVLVRFVAKRVFLIDLLEPFWSDRKDKGPATIGRNLFLIGKSRIWHDDVKQDRFDWIQFKDFEDPHKGWSVRRAALLESDRVILVEGFEHRLWDQEFNQKKLLFLEELARLQERTVIVTSKVSPAALFSRETGTAADGTAGGSALMDQRWRSLLGMFTVCEDDLQDILERVKTSDRIKSEILKEECGVNSHLLSIAEELDDHVGHLSREQILEEFGERAEGYYQGLWASCSPEEQVVLEHLAEEGLVNEKSRRVIRRLMARGFVRRDPHFRLMNETFRRFVISSKCKDEVLTLEKKAVPSSWDQLRGPLFTGLAATLLFFLATQQDLLDGLTASITGLAAGLPAIVKLFEYFGGSKSDLSRLADTK